MALADYVLGGEADLAGSLRTVLERIRTAGVGTAVLTLHVGLGTFRPVAVDRVEDHTMHTEWYQIPEAPTE